MSGKVLSGTCAGAMTAVSLAALPGCILQDIHDRVEETNLAIRETNQNLVQVTEELRRTNQIVERRLALLEQTNDHLGATRERLVILESIDGSLKALDHHLASLRETMDNVDSLIPFLDLADSPDDPAPAPASGEPGAAPPSEPAPDPASGPAPATSPGPAGEPVPSGAPTQPPGTPPVGAPS